MNLFFKSLIAIAPIAIALASVASVTFQDRTTAEIQVDTDGGQSTTKTNNPMSCTRALKRFEDIFNDISFTVHRSGEPEGCGTISSSIEDMMKALALQETCSFFPNKYQVESFLTEYFSRQLLDDGCGSTDDNNAPSGLLGYCDMGPNRTVIQKDHDSLVRVSSGSLPCRWYTREGLRISSLKQLADLAKKSLDKDCDNDDNESCPSTSLNLYAVPAGRMFMFAPSYIGEKFIIDHVQDSEGNTVTLEVLSLEPRVFDIFNFFNAAETEKLLAKALGETSDTHKFHRSTTGTSGASIFHKRTSENAWDTHGATSMAIKKRCFNLLGIDEYNEALADGLQVLRYNVSTAYTPHMDYLDDKAGKESYDYDSSGKGANRFATILLYFSDLGEKDGGETVFPRAYPPNLAPEDKKDLAQAIKELRESGDAPMLKEGSWEEEMTAQCRTRLSVRPKAQRAVLFYSQKPNGELDQFSFHGGCPALNPDNPKLAANLWTWSGIRPEYDGAPRKFEEPPKPKAQQIQAVFKNTKKDKRFKNAELYYDEDGFFGKIGFNDQPIYVNTYKSHRWNVKVDGKILKSFVITDELSQTFEV